MAEPMISLKALRFLHDGASMPLFADFNLDIARGQFCAILGISGTGKSTLLRLIAGLLKPSAGSVEREGRCAVSFQDARLLPWLSLRQNIQFGLKHRKADAQIDNALAMMRLQGLDNRYPAQLSGGQKQRAGLARALATDPSILLLDEPFSSLDDATKESLQADLYAVWKQTGMTIIMVTHDKDDAQKLAERVITLEGMPVTISADQRTNKP